MQQKPPGIDTAGAPNPITLDMPMAPFKSYIQKTRPSWVGSRVVGHTAWLTAALLGGAGCRSDSPTSSSVVVVAIDGLDRPYLQDLAARGELPTFSRLIEEGTLADLRVTDPLLSPRIWTTLASGYPSATHGVHGWMKRPGVLYGTADVATQRLWDVAGAHNQKTLVLGWLVTAPVVDLPGAMLADGFDGGVPMTAEVPEQSGPHPLDTDRARILASSNTAARTARGCIPTDAELARHPLAHQVEAYGAPAHPLRHDLAVVCAFENLDPRIDPDLTLLYLQGVDQISHHFWPFVDDTATSAMRANPQLRPSLAQKDRNRQRGQRPYPWVDTPTTEDILAAGAAWVPDYYRTVDALLARVLQRIDPTRTTVLVLSDHGFQSSRAPTAGLYGEHRSPAVFLAWGAGVPSAGVEPRPVDAVDIAPTILTRLGLPVADDMPGRVRGDLLALPTPVARVATYRRGEAEKALPNDALFDPRRMQQLEALGYIDDQGRPIDAAAGNTPAPHPAEHPAQRPPNP
jgi:hypothetical protein